jgi:hypothetical protein
MQIVIQVSREYKGMTGSRLLVFFGVSGNQPRNRRIIVLENFLLALSLDLSSLLLLFKSDNECWKLRIEPPGNWVINLFKGWQQGGVKKPSGVQEQSLRN